MSVRGKAFSAQKLIEYIGVDNKTVLCEILGVEWKTVHRWSENDIQFGWLRADRLARRVGAHPSEIWPVWFEENKTVLQ